MLNLKPGKLYKILSDQKIAIFRYSDGNVIDILKPDSNTVFLYLVKLPPDVFDERNNFTIKININFIRHKLLLPDGTLAYINIGRIENQKEIYYDPNIKWMEIFP